MPALESPRQLDLFDARQLGREARVGAARRIADAIADLLGERVRLTVHDNRSTMVSFRRVAGALHYRVHHMFLEAPGEVVGALAAFAGPARHGAARRPGAGVGLAAAPQAAGSSEASSRSVRPGSTRSSSVRSWL